MADHAEDLRQADLAKHPLFSGDKTDIFTCEQWISRVQRAKDSSGWNNARTMTYVLNALRGSAFAYTRSINLAAGVNIDDWDSFKAGAPEPPWLVPMASRTPHVPPPPSTPTVKLTPTPPPSSPLPLRQPLARDRSYSIRIHTLIRI